MHGMKGKNGTIAEFYVPTLMTVGSILAISSSYIQKYSMVINRKA